MGKIFDALEKADRKNAAAAHTTIRSQKVARLKKPSEKVVPLVNQNRDLSSSQLDETLIAYHEPQSVEAELFKVLRTNILFPASGQPPKTILITSALPGDGKSFISSNLAISIAQGIEEHVLLIDGDLRKPSIYSRFGINKVSGLSDYLAGGDDIANALVKTQIEKLTILPAGEPPDNPTELMSSKKMKALLEEVKNRYDDRYVLIDSPPPSMASETNAIAQYVDGVLIVVKAGKTPRAAVRDAIDNFDKDKLLGIVLNHADQAVRKYYGYGKSYYKNKS